MRSVLISISISISIAAAGCGTTADEANGPAATGATFTVRGRAALTSCPDCAPLPDPSLTYETPSALRIGVAEVALLRAADDPDPVVVVASTPAVDADLVAGATFAAVDTSHIPSGDYPYMRVTLDWMRYSIDAVGHGFGNVLPGTLAVDYAISSYDDPTQGARAQGDYLATFTSGSMSGVEEGVQPVNYPASFPGATLDVSGESCKLTFATPQGPIHVDAERPESVDVEVTYFVEDAFGWADVAGTNHAEGVFDLDLDTDISEVPAIMFVRGFTMDVAPGQQMP